MSDDVVYGDPESWNQFAERIQRQVGKAARVFVCKQVGVDNARPIIMILSPDAIRQDLVDEVIKPS